jgi:hypothetical protein
MRIFNRILRKLLFQRYASNQRDLNELVQIFNDLGYARADFWRFHHNQIYRLRGGLLGAYRVSATYIDGYNSPEIFATNSLHDVFRRPHSTYDLSLIARLPSLIRKTFCSSWRVNPRENDYTHNPWSHFADWIETQMRSTQGVFRQQKMALPHNLIFRPQMEQSK